MQKLCPLSSHIFPYFFTECNIGACSSYRSWWTTRGCSRILTFSYIAFHHFSLLYFSKDTRHRNSVRRLNCYSSTVREKRILIIILYNLSHNNHYYLLTIKPIRQWQNISITKVRSSVDRKCNNHIINSSVRYYVSNIKWVISLTFLLNFAVLISIKAAPTAFM